MFVGAHALVTGGSSGIGLACARAFADQGAHVALVARDSAKLERAAESVRTACREHSQRVLTSSADLSDFDSASGVLGALAAEGFVPDILLNSAGVILPGEFSAMPMAHLEANMDCGYWSVVNCCKAVVPGMIERGSGYIVNVSSVAGFLGVYGYTGYAAAKYAVLGFSEALRFEMRPHGVKVSVVLPPDTETPALKTERTMRPPETEAVVAGNSKAISPERVAEAVIKGMKRGRFHIIPDARSRLHFRLKGLLPELFLYVVDADIAKARRDR